MSSVIFSTQARYDKGPQNNPRLSPRTLTIAAGVEVYLYVERHTERKQWQLTSTTVEKHGMTGLRGGVMKKLFLRQTTQQK